MNWMSKAQASEEEAVPVDLRIDLNTIKRATPNEMRGAVKVYYALQEHRKQVRNRQAAAERNDAPHGLVDRLLARFETQEGFVRRVIHEWVKERDMGAWALKVHGIGPVIAGGLCAHIDPALLSSVSALWRYAGQDPTCLWPRAEVARAWAKERGISGEPGDEDYAAACKRFGRNFATLKRRAEFDPDGSRRAKVTVEHLIRAINKAPYNADLKVLCWKIGDSFVKVSGSEKSLYGRLYRQWKAEASVKNEARGFSPLAEKTLGSKTFTNATYIETYGKGMLPPGHLDAWVRRKVVKMFLSHYWEVARRKAGLPVRDAWVLGPGGHADKIEPEVPWDA